MDTVADGIHKFDNFKLGSIVGSGLADDRTLKLANFMDLSIQAPITWDFDKNRKPFPSHLWGNDQYGDCEVAARANYLVRLERIQTRSTPAITDDDVVELYKSMTGCVSAGDNNDTGLTTLGNLGAWRTGWNITKAWSKNAKPVSRDYQISAYGFVDPKNTSLLRLSSYLFSGALLGCNMPLTAYDQLRNNQPWDVDPLAGSKAEPGSWGGHCMYVKHYDANNIYAITWGREVKITNKWMDKYCEEAYSVIDAFDNWAKYSHIIDIPKLIQQMKDAGIRVQS